jgi:Bacterial Ig-like domain (group 3)/FG-GAP-like repeat
MKLLRFPSVFASVLVVVLAAAVAQAAGPLVTFAPASTPGYDSGGVGADQVILADLAGDGIPDMVVCNTDSYSVLLGNGDGTFNFNNNYPSAGTGANLCAVADFNGDGYLDIAATTNYNANDTGGGVDVLLGNGDGTFQDPVSFNAGPIETFAIAVGDINHDGIPDLALTSNCQFQTCLNGNVSVAFGKGDGTFQYPPTIVASGTGPVALADMNGDGNLDIVFDGGVLLGDGTNDGTFTPVSGGELLGGAVAIAIADVNGDGIPDVVQVTNNNVAGVLLGNGDGTLHQYASYKTGGFWPLSVTIADINGDGRPDLIVGNECQFTQKGSGHGRCNSIGEVSVLTNKGGLGPLFAGFNTARTFASGGFEASSVPVADVNGDGRPDLVISDVCTTSVVGDVPCSTDGFVAVLLNTSSFTTTTTLVPAPNPSFVNQSVLLTATVTSSGSVITNGDTVTFYDGANVLGTAPTTNGVATLSTSFPLKGKHFLKAAFPGDVWNAPSSGLATQVVNLYTSSTTVTATPTTQHRFNYITFVATVSSAAPGGPTGSVTFKKGSTSLGTQPLIGGVATLITSFSSVGSFAVTANYSGDSQSTTSSNSVAVTIQP